jgi:predicted small lipoprotein YifL
MRALLLMSVLLAAGCGQSGDLYLPPKQQPAESAPPIATPPPVEGPQEQTEEQKKERP